MAAPLLGRTAAFFEGLAQAEGPAPALLALEAEIRARRETAAEWERQGARGIAHAMHQAAEKLAATVPGFVERWA